MKELSVILDGKRDYKIIIGSGILKDFQNISAHLAKYTQCVLVSNDKVFGLYGEQVIKGLESIGKKCQVSILKDGERYKNEKSVQKIYEDCFNAGVDRKSLIIALGGGVIGDITGFAAATYMRGIDFMQIPTTLLAQVDSSVGGKTGINHPKCKNLIGAFHQPCLVFSDISILKTLPKREFLSGLAEVIKYGVILDKDFFGYIENHVKDILAQKTEVMEEIVYMSCKWKAEVVSKDEKESGLRAILNYGHTIGHAIESATNYKKYKHGEAISLGMVYAAQIACKKGMLDNASVEKQLSLLKKLKLPVSAKGVCVDSVILAMKSDKKFVSGKAKFVLPKSIGQVVFGVEIEDNLVKEVLEG